MGRDFFCSASCLWARNEHSFHSSKHCHSISLKKKEEEKENKKKETEKEKEKDETRWDSGPPENQFISVCMCTCLYVYIHIYTQILTYNMFIYKYIFMCIGRYIYTHIYIYVGLISKKSCPFLNGLFSHSIYCTFPAPDLPSTDACFTDEGAGSRTSFVLELRINLLFPSSLPGHFSGAQLCLLVRCCSDLEEQNDTGILLHGK